MYFVFECVWQMRYERPTCNVQIYSYDYYKVFYMLVLYGVSRKYSNRNINFFNQNGSF